MQLKLKYDYSLDTEHKIKMLRVIKKIKETSLLPLNQPLGARTIPNSYKEFDKYVQKIINEMIPEIANEKLADYIDVFVIKVFYS